MHVSKDYANSAVNPYSVYPTICLSVKPTIQRITIIPRGRRKEMEKNAAALTI